MYVVPGSTKVTDPTLVRSHLDNFRPPSVDPSKPGIVEVKKGQETTKVTVERANTHVGRTLVLLLGL